MGSLKDIGTVADVRSQDINERRRRRWRVQWKIRGSCAPGIPPCHWGFHHCKSSLLEEKVFTVARGLWSNECRKIERGKYKNMMRWCDGKAVKEHRGQGEMNGYRCWGEQKREWKNNQKQRERGYKPRDAFEEPTNTWRSKGSGCHSSTATQALT